MKFLRLLSLTIASLALVIFLAFPSVAHEKEHHNKSGAMSDHMKEMYALKDKIPEEYRIMERTPIIPSEMSLQQGQKIFEQYCLVCHGTAGDGKGPAAAAMPTPPANFLNKKHSDIYSPGEKYWIIGDGSGKTGMPSFPQIEPIDRWHLVNYILQLQENGASETKEHGHH